MVESFLVRIGGNVSGPMEFALGVLAGGEAGEGFEVVDEVGLVEIAAVLGEAGPVGLAGFARLVNGGAEALDALVELGGHAHLGAEGFAEAAVAEVGVVEESWEGKVDVAEGPVDGRVGTGALAEFLCEPGF